MQTAADFEYGWEEGERPRQVSLVGDEPVNWEALGAGAEAGAQNFTVGGLETAATFYPVLELFQGGAGALLNPSMWQARSDTLAWLATAHAEVPRSYQGRAAYDGASAFLTVTSVLLGGVIGGGGAATETGTFARELLPADLGLGEDAQFIGRISGIKGGVADVAVDWVGGEMGNSGMAALARIKDIARAEGATSIRIQTSRVVETTGVLRRWLASRGFQAMEDGAMRYEGPL
jgi:hypothetical protein